MKIAVINEDSQAGKNELICSILKEVATPHHHEVINLGMCSENDAHEINFTEIGVIASIVVECGIADFIVTGCGTGQGAMMSCNAFFNLYCGYVAQPLDAWLFAQVNAGNCISMPFAQNFGWGSEISLRYVFERLFEDDFGMGYPQIHAQGEKRSRQNFKDAIKGRISKTPYEAIRSMDPSYLTSILNYKEFKDNFTTYAKPCELRDYIKELLHL